VFQPAPAGSHSVDECQRISAPSTLRPLRSRGSRDFLPSTQTAPRVARGCDESRSKGSGQKRRCCPAASSFSRSICSGVLRSGCFGRPLPARPQSQTRAARSCFLPPRHPMSCGRSEHSPRFALPLSCPPAPLSGAKRGKRSGPPQGHRPHIHGLGECPQRGRGRSPWGASRLCVGEARGYVDDAASRHRASYPPARLRRSLRG
jgi:hypothetical protein